MLIELMFRKIGKELEIYFLIQFWKKILKIYISIFLKLENQFTIFLKNIFFFIFLITMMKTTIFLKFFYLIHSITFLLFQMFNFINYFSFHIFSDLHFLEFFEIFFYQNQINKKYIFDCNKKQDKKKISHMIKIFFNRSKKNNFKNKENIYVDFQNNLKKSLKKIKNKNISKNDNYFLKKKFKSKILKKVIPIKIIKKLNDLDIKINLLKKKKF